MNLDQTVIQVHIEDIIPNRFQPRLNFDEEALQEVAFFRDACRRESIKS